MAKIIEIHRILVNLVNNANMLYAWVIFTLSNLQNWVILFGQMLGNIPYIEHMGWYMICKYGIIWIYIYIIVTINYYNYMGVYDINYLLLDTKFVNIATGSLKLANGGFGMASTSFHDVVCLFACLLV